VHLESNRPSARARATKAKGGILVCARTDEGKQASHWGWLAQVDLLRDRLGRPTRQADNTMRLPLEIAMEVGSFLDRPSLTMCTTQLCWSGVGFVSRPCTASAKATTIQLHDLGPLCRTATRTLTMGQERANGLAAEAIKRIDLCLGRRTSAKKIVFEFDLRWMDARYLSMYTDFYSHIHRHYSLSSNLQFENGPSLAVEWHAFAVSIAEVTFLRGERNGGRLNDVSALTSCSALHKLDLSRSQVKDVSALASFQALHTLDLSETQVSDASALASCQALHTLDLSKTQVSDASALASCQALHTLDLNDTRVSDASALASCRALRTLHLRRTKVIDVSALASCQALRTLELDGTQVRDVSALASCRALRTLRLSDTQVTDVSPLASCQALHMLDLSNTQVSDVSSLASCRSLHTLNLIATQVTDVSLLASCHALHELYLSFTKVSDVSALAACQALHTLRLMYTDVSDVSALASCPALHALHLNNTQVSDVSALASCGSLRYLFGDAHTLGYEAIARLLENRR
jgi:Leucine-rich repeat (LRR) protein